MSAYAGSIVGGFLLVLFLTLIVELLLRKVLSGTMLEVGSVFVAAALAMGIYAIAFFEGSEPSLKYGLVGYGVGGMIVFLMWCIGRLGRSVEHG